MPIKKAAFAALAGLALLAAGAQAQKEEQIPLPDEQGEAKMEVAVDTSAAAVPATPKFTPVYLSNSPDLNAYYMYADGGMDANWFVGYSNCWMVKLPAAPVGRFSKAFIGARLGRSKSTPKPDKPWELSPIQGKIFMALSQSLAFTSQQTYFLVENSDIPREPTPKDSLEGVGAAQWFWAEVPVSSIATDKPNYLALWSNSEALSSASNSPIVAGGEMRGVTEQRVWVNSTLKGTPPRESDSSPGTSISSMSPAMVIKLVPVNEARVIVRALTLTPSAMGPVAAFSAIGQDISAAWLEISPDRFTWSRISRIFTTPPYSMTFTKAMLPTEDTYFIRAVAQDNLSNTGYSKELTISRKDIP